MSSYEKIIGMIFDSVEQGTYYGDDAVVFSINGKKKFVLYHRQDCCESVNIEDISGDLNDLVGTPILEASERYEAGEDDEWGGSSTWSFYSFRTIKGSVLIRFFGSSNGYYGETAYLEEID